MKDRNLDPQMKENGSAPQEITADQVQGVERATSKATLEVLEGGAKRYGKAEDKDYLQVAGQEIPDPKRAYENLKGTLTEVKKALGRHFDIREDEIYFQKFTGNQVGESTVEGAHLDPVVLLYPANRAAKVAGHEIVHNKRKVLKEDLVQAYVDLWFDGPEGVEHTYKQAVERFHDFLNKYADGRDEKAAVREIYELYYSGRYDEIYQKFKENYMDKLDTEEQKDEAHLFFETVFPELGYGANKEKPGYFDVKQLEDEEPKVTPPTEINEYRKKVEEREAEVKSKTARRRA